MAIETGRFQNLPLEERLCKFCRYNVLEDEAHFLLICPAFSNVRSVLLDKVISIEPGYLFLDKENKLKLLNILQLLFLMPCRIGEIFCITDYIV